MKALFTDSAIATHAPRLPEAGPSQAIRVSMDLRTRVRVRARIGKPEDTECVCP